MAITAPIPSRICARLVDGTFYASSIVGFRRQGVDRSKRRPPDGASECTSLPILNQGKEARARWLDVGQTIYEQQDRGLSSWEYHNSSTMAFRNINWTRRHDAQGSVEAMRILHTKNSAGS